MMKGDIEMILGIDTNELIALHKEYQITGFNWTLEFIFKQGNYSNSETEILKSELGSLLGNEGQNKLIALLNKSTYNSALSVSIKHKRKSVMLISKVTTMGQFINSLVHEILHLSRHIDECNNNEELFTILGNISEDIVEDLYNV